MSDSVEQKLNDIMTVLTGGHDSSGVYYPGLSPRVLAIEKRLEAIEKEKEEYNAGKLTVGRGITIATIGGVITQALVYVKEHLPR